MKFSHKIMLLPGLTAVAFALLFAGLWTATKQSGVTIRRVQQEFFHALELSHGLETEALTIRHLLTEAVTTGNRDLVGEAESRAGDFRSALIECSHLPNLANGTADSLMVGFDRYFDLARETTLDLIPGDQELDLDFDSELLHRVAEMNRSYEMLQGELKAVVMQTNDALENALEETRDRIARTRRRTNLVGLVFLGILVTISIGIVGSILRPVQRMSKVAMSIAGGDLSQNLEYRSDDALGELANCFREMQHALVEDIKRREAAEAALRDAAHAAGMAEIATSVLHNVGNVLNSATTSTGVLARTLHDSRVTHLERLAELVQANSTDEGDFARYVADDPKGRDLPGFFVQLAGVIGAERERLAAEMATIEKSLDHIKEIIALQQNYAGVAGIQEEVVVRDLVNDAVHLFGSSFQRHHIDFQVHQNQPAPPALVEKNKALQVIINLLKNARDSVRDADSETRAITVSIASGEEGYVEIRVEDTGVGIAAGDLERIFNYGFTTKKDGHGYGLHGSANTAREMGGSVTASSDGPGQGAVFALTLPAAPATK